MNSAVARVVVAPQHLPERVVLRFGDGRHLDLVEESTFVVHFGGPAGRREA